MFHPIVEPKKRKVQEISSNYSGEAQLKCLKPSSLLSMTNETDKSNSSDLGLLPDCDGVSSKSENTPTVTDESCNKNSLGSVHVQEKKGSRNGDTLLRTEIEVQSVNHSDNELTLEHSFDITIDPLSDAENSNTTSSDAPDGKTYKPE